MADFTIDVYEINERPTMTRNEIADKATQEITRLFPISLESSFQVIKAIILTALLEMSNDQLERDLESTRKQLAAMRGDDET